MTIALTLLLQSHFSVSPVWQYVIFGLDGSVMVAAAAKENMLIILICNFWDSTAQTNKRGKPS